MRRSDPSERTIHGILPVRLPVNIADSANYSDYELLHGITPEIFFFCSGCYFLPERAGNPDRKQDCWLPSSFARQKCLSLFELTVSIEV